MLQVTHLKEEIAVAQKEKKADLVISNITVLDMFNQSTYISDVAVYKDRIVAIGDYKGSGLKEIDGTGKFLSPTLIDTHLHIESSLVPPYTYTKEIVKHGVTTLIADPHEIANVAGSDGIDFMLNSAKNSYANIYFTLPSCVPATPFENTGATLSSNDLEGYYHQKWVIGLGEMMNYPGVLSRADDVLEKIVVANIKKKTLDGHIAGISDDRLNGYILTGIKTDHECATVEEANERLKRGMAVLIREGSAAKNFDTLIDAVTQENNAMFAFCSDDKHLDEIVAEGTVRRSVIKAIERGMSPLLALKIATLNAARIYNLKGLGGIAPGYLADFMILRNLETVDIESVFHNGEEVVHNGVVVEKEKLSETSIRIPLKFSLTRENLKIPAQSGAKAHIIEIIPNEIVTKKSVEVIDSHNGEFVTSREKDLTKIAVINRYGKETIGLGIVKGMKLKSGAVATTVAHDSHNVIVIGTNDLDMCVAAEKLKETHGGLVIVENGEVLALQALEIGGLMTHDTVETVLENLKTLHEACNHVFDTLTFHPFLTLSFLSLPVIPEIKLTDCGLFDVTQFEFIPLIIK